MKNKFLVLDDNNIIGVLSLDLSINKKRSIIEQLKEIFTYENILNQKGKEFGDGLLDRDTICDLCLWEGFSIDFIKLLDYPIGAGKYGNDIYEISIYGDNGVKVLQVVNINDFKKLN